MKPRAIQAGSGVLYTEVMNIQELSGLVEVVAVATSGGADSLALAHMLCAASKAPVHILTVDHGLRTESKAEAAQVAKIVASWPNAIHKTLVWQGDKPSTRILEAARLARYSLMAEYCAQNGIQKLYLAHHGDDQAETILIRLSKGSGVDGLSGMRAVQDYSENLKLIRPLLKYRHQDCVEYCIAHGLKWVEDPSNTNEKYLRPRLRAVSDVLAKEGLTTPRLMRTAHRMGQAAETLDWALAQVWGRALMSQTSDEMTLSVEVLKGLPADLVTRVVRKAMRLLAPDRAYDPRLERVEVLVADFMVLWEMKGRTLGGCRISINSKTKMLVVSKE